MARATTLLRFDIELSDIDRGVYESLDLRVAQHPSEDAQRVVIRVLARCLEHEEGLAFGRGLSEPDDPALLTSSLTGQVTRIVEIGAPSADRLHRASKRCDKLSVVTDKQASNLRREWGSRAIHGAERIRILQIPTELTERLAEKVARQNPWFVTLHDGSVTVAIGEASHAGEIARSSLAEFLESSP